VEALRRNGHSLGRRVVTPLLAIAIASGVGLATRVPAAAPPPGIERLRFERHVLPSIPVAGVKSVRRVAPAVRRYDAWISGVGAAVALTDADGNGRSDDVCLVDPRTDTITLSPAAGTGERFLPFVLDPEPLPLHRSTAAPTGCLPGDFDEDGHTDFIAYYWGRSPIVFERRPGVPLGGDAFTRTELVTPVERWNTDTVAHADVDADGHADLVIGNYFPDGASVLDPAAHRNPALQMNASMSRARNGGTVRILLWTPTGRFAPATADLPHGGRAWTLAIGAYDLTGDLLPELYFANDFGPDWLLLNRSAPGQVRFTELRGRKGFSIPKSKELGNDSYKGMGIDFADMDGDGRTDMFVSNITARFGLIESNFAWINDGDRRDMARGVAPFRDRSEPLGLARSGWGWDAKFGDFRNTGTPELVQTTGFLTGTINRWPQITELAMANDDVLKDPSMWPNVKPGSDLSGHERVRFFVKGEDGRWADASRIVGLDAGAVSRGVATADVNADGLLDVAIAHQWARSYLYLNRCRACGRALDLRILRATGGSGQRVVRAGAAGDRLTGVPALGARVTMRGPDGAQQAAEVDAGNGHASVRSPELHFGLGPVAATRRVPVTVEWRDGDGATHRTRLALRPGRWTIVLREVRDA